MNPLPQSQWTTRGFLAKGEDGEEEGMVSLIAGGGSEGRGGERLPLTMGNNSDVVAAVSFPPSLPLSIHPSTHREPRCPPTRHSW